MEMMSKTYPNCINCERDIATHGQTCQACHALLLAVVTIRADWSTEEYKDVGEMLRGKTLVAFTKESAIHGALKCAALGSILHKLRHLSGIDEDQFKARLFSHLTKEAAEIEGIKKAPGGLEHYRKRVYAAAGQIKQAMEDAAAKCRAEEKAKTRYHQTA